MNDKWLFFNEADEEEKKDKKEDNDDKKKDKDEKEKELDKALDKDDEDEIKNAEPDGDEKEFEKDLKEDEEDIDDGYNDIIPDDDSDEELPTHDADDDNDDTVDGSDDTSPEYNDFIGDIDDDSSISSSEPSGLYDTVANIGYAYCVIRDNIHHVHLNVKGKHFDTIHRVADELHNHFKYMIDEMFELALEGDINIDNPSNASKHCQDIALTIDHSYDYDTACRVISQSLERALYYISTARAASEIRPDIQSKLDDEAAYVNKQLKYFMKHRTNDGLDGETQETHIDIVSKVNESYNILI